MACQIEVSKGPTRELGLNFKEQFFPDGEMQEIRSERGSKVFQRKEALLETKDMRDGDLNLLGGIKEENM